MQNLSRLSRGVRIFIGLGYRDKKLLMEALILTGLVRLLIILIPFKRIRKHLGIYKEESTSNVDPSCHNIIKKISWAVDKVSRYTPWESKCMVQAITAQKMLKRRKIFSTLYLGVAKNKEKNLLAHAWLRTGQFIVTGGLEMNKFKEVARFSNSGPSEE